MILVSEANVAYADPTADLTLTANKRVASNVVTPPSPTTCLQFLVRLQASAIMYLVSGGASGAVNSGVAITADQWWTFSMIWTPARSFSVRFSVAQANLRDLIVNAIGQGLDEGRP